MPSFTRVIKNTGFLYVRLIVSFLLSIFTTRILLKALGVSDFGTYQVVAGVVAMLLFLNSSLASATQRFMSYAKGEGNFEKQKVIFNVSLVLHFIIAVIICLLFMIGGFFFFNGILNIEVHRLFAAKVAYSCLIISTLFSIVNVPYDAVINAHENMLYYSIIGIVESFLKLLIAIACVYTCHDKLIVYSVLMAIIPFATLTVMKIYCHRHYEECVISFHKYIKRPVMISMAKYAGWNVFGSFAGLVSGHGTNILLNHFFGTAVNAAMGVYGQLNAQMQSFSTTLLKALNPVLVKSEGEKNRQAMYKYAFTGAKLSVCLYAFFAIPIIIDRDFILDLWLAKVPPYTASFVQLALIWTFFSQVGGTLYTTIGAIGKIKETQIINAILRLVNLFFIYLAFSHDYPPYIWMIISCITSFIQLIVVVSYNKKYGGMNVLSYFLEVFCRTLGAIAISFVTVYIIWLFIDHHIIRFIVTIISSLVIYGLLFFLMALDRFEKKKLLELCCQLNKIHKK